VSAGALRSITIVGQIEAISSKLRMYARTKHRDRTAVPVVSALLRFLVALAPGSCYSAPNICSEAPNRAPTTTEGWVQST
jgi:hypothetical protein